VVADRRTLELSLIGKETVSGAARTAGRALDDMGDEAKGAIRDFEKLDRQIAQTEAVIAGLAAEIAATGDVDLFKDLNRNRSLLRSLQGVRHQFAETGDDAGRDFSLSFFQRFGAITARAPISPYLLPIFAAAAVPVGAAFGGALLAAAGTAVAAGGVLVAFKDADVKAEGQRLGQQLGAELSRAFGPAFIPAAHRALSELSTDLAGLEPQLKRLSAAAAVFVLPLERGLSGLIKGVLPGLTSALEKSGAVFAVLQEHGRKLGEALGQMFSDIAGASTGGALALGDFLTALEKTVVATGKLISFFEGLYTAFRSGGRPDKIAEALAQQQHLSADLRGEIEGLIGGFRSAGSAAGGMADSTAAASAALQNYHSQLEKLTNPIAAFIGAQKDARDAQKEYNQALKEHGPKSAAAREASLKLVSAALALQGAAGDVAGTLGSNLDPALHDTLVAAYGTSRAVKGAEGAFHGARSAAASYAKKWQATAVLNGVTQAKRNADTLRRSLDSIDRYISVNINVTTHYSGGKPLAMQHGGHAPAGAVRWVGEAGPELVRFRTPATVYSASRSRTMAASMARSVSGGGGGTTILVAPAPGRRSAMVDMFLELLRTNQIQMIVGSDGTVRAR
jgi:nitroreductase